MKYSPIFLESNRNFTKLDKLSYCLEDVFIDTKTGLILDLDRNILWDFAYEVLYWNPTIRPPSFKSQNELNKVLNEKKEKYQDELRTLSAREFVRCHRFSDEEDVLYFLHPFGWYPYGHLHDTLQRAFALDRERITNPVLLCSKFNRVVDFDKHIEAVGYSMDKVQLSSKLTRIVYVPKLYFGVSPAVYTTFTPESYEWITSGYEKVFGAEEKAIEGLYLSRNGVKKGARGVINDGEVVEYLKSKGFIILDGSESLEVIFKKFRAAKYIVAPHGSLLANSIFCREDCRIIEYCPSNRADYSFKNKYKAAKDYRHFLLDGDVDFNISIPLEHLKEQLI